MKEEAKSFVKRMTGGFEGLGPKSGKPSGKWGMKDGLLKTVS